jgi:pimeloyl-ACP methyl ester carboxylesterase
MGTPAIRTLRYARSWLTGRDDVRARELRLDRDGVPVAATLLTPGDLPGPLPAWIILHGITRPGRGHRQLVRFTRALAEGGCAVLVPEVPEWRELDVAPSLTVPTVLASLRALTELGGLISASPPGLLGFSFGAPQAIAASAHPDLRGRLAGTVGFGGYCDLERTVVFQLTGRHDYGGLHHHLRPDPYGRWIVAANYLTAVPGYEDAAPVAAGLRRLAALAGDVGVVSWHPRFDPPREEIRRTLAPALREVFDLFAPGSAHDPEPTAAEEMAHLLAAAARGVEPGIEPVFQGAAGPVHLLHGRQDHLIPFTEVHRLGEAMPAGVEVRTTVTSLFGHSAQDPWPAWREAVPEATALIRALSGVFGVV